MLDTYGLEKKFNISFDIILVEDAGTKIYTSNALDKSEETVEKRLYKKYSIIDSIYMNDNTYYLIKNENSIIGWVNLKNSIVLFNKKVTAVKVLNDNYEKLDINSTINIELGLFDISKIYTSRYYVIKNGVILEALVEKNKIRAIIKTQDLDHSITVNRKIKINSNVKLYKESGMKNLIDEQIANTKVVLVDYFEKLNMARIDINKNKYWLTLDSLDVNNLPSLTKKVVDFQEVFFNHIASSLIRNETKSKNIIKQLLKENRELITVIEEFNESNVPQKSQQLKNIERKYENLKNSKLGKIQIAYWNFRNKRRS